MWLAHSGALKLMVAVLRYSSPTIADSQPLISLIFFACLARLADPAVDYLDAEYRHIIGVA
jgi:hypothetical protein